jgi:hypothetical protein
MGNWKKIGSYDNRLLISSVKPDKYDKFIKIEVNSSKIIIDKNQAKEIAQHLIEKYL